MSILPLGEKLSEGNSYSNTEKLKAEKLILLRQGYGATRTLKSGKAEIGKGSACRSEVSRLVSRHLPLRSTATSRRHRPCRSSQSLHSSRLRRAKEDPPSHKAMAWQAEDTGAYSVNSGTFSSSYFWMRTPSTSISEASGWCSSSATSSVTRRI